MPTQVVNLHATGGYFMLKYGANNYTHALRHDSPAALVAKALQARLSL